MKMRIPYRFVHIVAFLLLAFLCYQAHQLTRLLVGAALCGGFGTMTFTITITREPCALPTLVTLSGPLLTYGLAYLGMFLLRAPKYRLFAYALLFASFSHLRFIQTLTSRGDELILARQWLGITSRSIVALIVFLIGVPPILVAFRAIANQRRWRVFLVSWLLPLSVLFVMLFANQFLFGANGNERLGTLVLGISLIVFLVDLIATVLLIVWGRRYFRPREEVWGALVLIAAPGEAPMVHHLVAALIIRSDRILLGKRSASRAFYPSVWDVFGGHIEPGEQPDQALVREIQEELGITPTQWMDLETIQQSVPGRNADPPDDLIARFYCVTAWLGTPFNRQPHEHSTIRWFSYAEAVQLDLADPAYPRLFAQCLQTKVDNDM